MIPDARLLLILVFLGALPLAATAQMFGQGQVPQQGGASSVNPPQGSIAQPGITVVPPANANAMLQRQQRGDRGVDP